MCDSVINLQASADGGVKRLANECVLKCDFLKMVCGDVGADDPVVSAAACSRLRRTLQARVNDVVAAIVVDGDTPGHLVRLLTSTIPSCEDCAACIGLLSDCAFRHRYVSSQTNVVIQFTKLLDNFVCRDVGEAHCLRALVSVMRSSGGCLRLGLLMTLESFLSTYGNGVIIRKLVASHNILPTCLDILRSSPSSECFHFVLSILQKILQSDSQVASGTATSYVADLHELGAEQVLQSCDCFRTDDTVAIVD
jgi:hypothetical protein